MVEDIKISSVEEKENGITDDVSQQSNNKNIENPQLNDSKQGNNENFKAIVIEKEKEEAQKEVKVKEDSKQDKKKELKVENNDEDDISIDFKELKNKIIGWFKKTDKKETYKEHEKESSDSEEMDALDLKTAISFAKNNAKWLIPLLCILIAMFASIYLRTMPLNMPITDDWAENTVYNFYQSQVSDQINLQYPNLPQQNKDALVQKEFQKLKEQSKDQINSEIKQISQQYKEQFRDNEGNLYLLGIDPWHFYRQTSYNVENGYPGSELVDGIPRDMYRLAPTGVETYLDFHVWFGTQLHKLLNLFFTVPLLLSFFLIGTIFSALSVIPAFFIGKRISNNNVGGFFTAMLVAVSAFFVSRTTGESSDTDVYVVFFPLLILWLIFEALSEKDVKKKFYWLASAGLATGLFSWAWGVWWYTFTLFVGAMFVYLIYQIIIDYKNIKEHIKSKEIRSTIYLIGGYILSSGIFVTLFTSFATFYGSFLAPIKSLTLKSVAVTSLWPNIFTTVAELNVVPLSQVISQLGGKLLFTLAIIGVILTIVQKGKDEKKRVSTAIFLLIWFLAALYTTTKGMRFTLLAIPSFAISFGAFLGISWRYVSKWTSKELHLNKNITKIVVFVILGMLIIQPTLAGYNSAHNSVPSMNDEWYNTLTKIKNEAPENIIITSWWDFGYWFRAVADRPVTFDGGTQVGHGAYWVGKSLLADDEKVSIGILRMLNCGQNDAFEVLNKIVENTPRSIKIINEIITLDKNGAIKKLSQEGLSKEQIAEVIVKTHCDAPIDYYIASEDMVSKAGVWGHFGSWDFEKALMYQETKEMKKDSAISYLVQEFELSDEEADRTYYEIQTIDADQWIAPWPGYHSGLNPCQKQNDNSTVICNIATQQGVITFNIDLNKEEATVKTSDNQELFPSSFVFTANNKIKQKVYPESTIGSSFILIPSEDSFQAMLSDPLHAYSTFTKLFFFNGLGMDCFNKFDEIQQFTGGRVSTWVVDYDCTKGN